MADAAEAIDEWMTSTDVKCLLCRLEACSEADIRGVERPCRPPAGYREMLATNCCEVWCCSFRSRQSVGFHKRDSDSHGD